MKESEELELVITADADTEATTTSSNSVIKLIAHNSRSLNMVNLHATAAMLELHSPTLFLASETWNMKENITAHQDYSCILSKPCRYEGCAIFYKKEIDIRPYKEEKWTQNYIFAKMDNTIVIAIYLNPRNPKE